MDHWQKQHKRSFLPLDKRRNDRRKFSVFVYEALPGAGKASHDFITWAGLFVAWVQIMASTVPAISDNDFNTFCLTLFATSLTFSQAFLPQWSDEVRNCRKDSKKTIVLTAGNRRGDALVIIGNSHGLDLEDMAAASHTGSFTPSSPRDRRMSRMGWSAVSLSIILMALVLIPTIFATSAWYLFYIAGIGFIYNLTIAHYPRHPSTHGLHLAYKETIAADSVMETLVIAETKYPRLGLSMVNVFYPVLTTREKLFWAYAERRAKAYDTARLKGENARMHSMPDIHGDEEIPLEGFL